MILIEAKVNARWSLDFINDQLACGRPVEVPLSIRRPFSCRAERQQLEVGLIGGASVKARVWPAAVVQRGLLTPTELSFVNCSTGGIRGLVFGSAFS